MNITKKFIVFIEIFTLIALWACLFFLNASTESLTVSILTSIVMSIGAFGTGFIVYEIWKEWKSIESN